MFTAKLIATTVVWLAGAVSFYIIEFLAVYVIVSGIVLIFLNTGTRTTGPSAYSVFNRDGARLTGTFDPSGLEQMVTGRSFQANTQEGGPKYAGLVFDDQNANTRVRPPKPNRRIGRNEVCYCGSGKKYKSCCESLDEAKDSSDSDSE